MAGGEGVRKWNTWRWGCAQSMGASDVAVRVTVVYRFCLFCLFCVFLSCCHKIGPRASVRRWVGKWVGKDQGL